jgi:hypothetical protein
VKFGAKAKLSDKQIEQMKTDRADGVLSYPKLVYIGLFHSPPIFASYFMIKKMQVNVKIT